MGLSILVIGDPHFKVGNIRETDVMTERVVSLARERNPDVIVCLGDILDRHETIHVSPLERATTMLRRLQEIAPVYDLMGNHDRPNNSDFLTTAHPFNALKLWNNTTIVDQGHIATIKGHKLLFVPYVPNGRFEEAIRTLFPGRNEDLATILSDITCVFAHQEFRHAKMGAILSEVGDEWPLNCPYVISGHIHDYDQLSSNILYVGTPIQHAFGDRDDKTVSWVEWPSIPEETIIQPIIPVHQRIDLGLEKKIIVYLSCQEVSTYEPPLGKQIKIVVTGTSAEIKTVMKLSHLKTLTSAGIKIVYKDTPSNSLAPIRGENYIQKKYTELLYDALNNDSELISLCRRIISDEGSAPISSVNHGPKLTIL